ncbi:TetR/AcrR family transcriptional regulator C-terminal domain-containing protein [Actinophytocola sp.]|uniref:TetR/AcrR family transcriptional regulator C-terminal domain-containing protein n=1 Tax=Actinophytocola sp. TaxID=1872138 RepID=UPI0025C3E94F|nr:TetR/AcrR family transcriptional regulator C-terminal domain-containing protein [Actinophytocola sp.]
MTVLSGAGLAEEDWLSSAILLDGYARTTAALARDLDESPATPVQSAEVTGFLHPLLSERDFPVLAAMPAARQYADSSPEPDISYGLDRILDGLEARIAGGTGAQ